MTQLAMKALTMTDEEQTVGNDLVKHHMDRIQEVVNDFVQLHEHPAQLYMLNNAALQFFMSGMALFDVTPSAKAPVNTVNSMDRIIKNAGVAIIMTLAHRGSKECLALMDHKNRIGKLNRRDVMRLLADLSTTEPSCS